MTSLREDKTGKHEQILLSANSRLLEMRAYRLTQQEKIEKRISEGLGREKGIGRVVNVGKIIKPIFNDIRANYLAHEKQNELLAIWREVSGEQIALATINVKMHNGFFYVFIDNHILKQEIENFRNALLLSEVKKRLPGTIIRGLRVKIGNKE